MAAIGRNGVLIVLLSVGNLALAQSAPHDGALSAAKRGAQTFQKYCALCHGEKGDGDGAAARLYNPRPANLTVSPRSRAYMERIIRGGGTVVGRSSAMPSWEEELGDQGVGDVLTYLQTIRLKQP